MRESDVSITITCDTCRSSIQITVPTDKWLVAHIDGNMLALGWLTTDGDVCPACKPKPTPDQQEMESE